MKETMKVISESTPLTIGFVLILLGGVWSFAWSAAGMKRASEETAKAVEVVALQLTQTTTDLRSEIQMEVNRRVLRHEVDAWVSELRLSNPGMTIPAVPRFQ